MLFPTQAQLNQAALVAEFGGPGSGQKGHTTEKTDQKGGKNPYGHGTPTAKDKEKADLHEVAAAAHLESAHVHASAGTTEQQQFDSRWKAEQATNKATDEGKYYSGLSMNKSESLAQRSLAQLGKTKDNVSAHAAIAALHLKAARQYRRLEPKEFS